MASGIENSVSAVTQSISAHFGPAARQHAPARGRDQRPGSAAPAVGRPGPQQGSGRIDWEQVTQARKETLAVLMEYAQRSALASDTTIYYQKDDQNGRMYLHVMDKETGKELYRIPKDYLPAPSVKAAESHHLDVQV